MKLIAVEGRSNIFEVRASLLFAAGWEAIMLTPETPLTAGHERGGTEAPSSEMTGESICMHADLDCSIKLKYKHI
jgi:hypothetical protein